MEKYVFGYWKCRNCKKVHREELRGDNTKPNQEDFIVESVVISMVDMKKILSCKCMDMAIHEFMGYKSFKNELWDRKIDEDMLSIRTCNVLKSMGVLTYEELLSIPKDDLFKYKNFGRKTLLELTDHLKSLGHKVGELA